MRKCILRYTDFLYVRSRKNQKVRVPEYTFSLLPLNLVQFGFCTNLVRFRFFSLNKVVERTDGVQGSGFEVEGQGFELLELRVLGLRFRV